MPFKFDDLGTVGTIARKLQKKLSGRDDNYEHGTNGSYPTYDQRPQSYGPPQHGQYVAPQNHYAHHQPQQRPHSQHSPYPPQNQGQAHPHHTPQQRAQHPQAYQHSSPRPMPSSPRPMEPSRLMNHRTQQPQYGSYGSPSTRPASFQQSPGHNRIPPSSSHIDTKTGRVQTNMFPPGYDGPLLQR